MEPVPNASNEENPSPDRLWAPGESLLLFSLKWDVFMIAFFPRLKELCESGKLLELEVMDYSKEAVFSR